MQRASFLLAGLLALLTATTTQAQPQVAASIRPIHALVAGVMAGVGEPALLIKGVASPHDYSLRPSDLRTINGAAVVFWVGENMESVLAQPLVNAGNTRSVELAEAPGVELLEIREGGSWDAHAHDHDTHDEHDEHGHEDHDHDHEEHHEEHHEKHHGSLDAHIWLDPRNAMAMVAQIARVLGEVDPQRAGTYDRNARQLTDRLKALDRELADTLAPVQEVPYFVFHDAYQYFENRYDLNALGSITLDPERLPGARRVKEIRDRIQAGEARCLFSEPQFQSDLVTTLVEGTSAGTGVLDPLGGDGAAGEEAYFRLLRELAAGLKDCLAR